MIDNAIKYLVFRELYYKQTLSCAGLSDILGKSIPVIAKVIDQLSEAGLVTGSGYAPSSGGRRPQTYSLKANRMYIVSVAMDQLFTKVAITDLGQKEIVPAETFALTLADKKGTTQKLVDIVNTVLEKTGIDRNQVMGVGIGMPGFINTTLGINYSYLPVGGNSENLRMYLQRMLGLPVEIDNDSSVIALAELRFGLAKDIQDVMVVNMGWGIGLGMIIKGEIFRGFAGYAGELSHIPINDSDILCDCGKRGCLETEASLKVIVDKALTEIKGKKTSGINFEGNHDQVSESIMTAASLGDPDAIDLLTDMAYKIGKALAILIHIVNPELIVLSGRGMRAGRLLMAPVEQALNRFCIPRLIEHTKIKTSVLGSDASLKGAAALVVDHFQYNTK
ncbi:MAG: ROK family protein [Chitinophagaceae bacterium]|nr:ROK family protein [Chitinophagaceae bacterium]